MNWGRAKTILIIMFLITDVFLLLVLMRTRVETLQIPQKTITETVEILSQNHIGIKKEQIPSKRVENQNVIMENFCQHPQETAEKLLGSGAELVSSVPDEYVYQFESPQGILYIQGNGFRFQNKKVPVTDSANNHLPNEEISDIVAAVLEKHGFLKNTVFIYNIWNDAGIYRCDAMPIYNDAKIHGISMHITADAEDILTMEGHWFEPVEVEHNKQERLLDVTTVLTNMALSGIENRIEVLDVSHGFYASDDFLNSLEFAAVPIYVITDSAGNTYKFDARMGNKVE